MYNYVLDGAVVYCNSPRTLFVRPDCRVARSKRVYIAQNAFALPKKQSHCRVPQNVALSGFTKDAFMLSCNNPIIAKLIISKKIFIEIKKM